MDNIAAVCAVDESYIYLVAITVNDAETSAVKYSKTTDVATVASKTTNVLQRIRMK